MKSSTVTVQQTPRALSWWALLLAGIVAAVVGVLLIVSPQTTANYLFLVLGALCIGGGLVFLASILFSRTSWGWKLLAGFLAFIVGLALISQPLLSAYVVAATLVWILGAVIILGGIGIIIYGFGFDRWWLALLGILVVVLGILLIFVSVVAPTSAPWAYGIAAVAGGILAIVGAFRMRTGGQPPTGG